jgi:predicted ATPase
MHNEANLLRCHLKPIKRFMRPKDWYLQAESFYSVASCMDGIAHPTMQGYAGKSLHQQSHGEAQQSTRNVLYAHHQHPE